VLMCYRVQMWKNNSRTEISSLLRRRASSFKTGSFHLDKTGDL